jgi:hypothetical protein
MADVVEVDFDPVEESKKPSAIVSARKEHKTLWQRITSAIFVAGPKDIKDALIDDVIIPAIKDTFANSVYRLVDVAVYGRDSRVSRRHRGHNGVRTVNSRNEVIDYNKQSTSKRERTTTGSSYDFENVIFNTTEEADEVLKDLIDTLNEYGEVTVYYFYERCGITAEFTDQNWGWKSLNSTGRRFFPDGVSLDLPKPIWLK